MNNTIRPTNTKENVILIIMLLIFTLFFSVVLPLPYLTYSYCISNTPESWIKYKGKECKFAFGEDVKITKGFYKGSEGVILDYREDGYVIDLYAYRIRKPDGQVKDRETIIYSVPESDIEPK